MLRQSGKEFTLEMRDGRWQFRPVQNDKVRTAGHRFTWNQHNPYEDQPLRLRLQAQMSVDPWDAPGNIQLAGFRNDQEFTLDASAPGVHGSFHAVGDTMGIFTVESDGTSVREGSWIKWQKTFEPCLNLNEHQGLGVWVKGDGSGALLNLRTESPRHMSMGARGDHFIKLDFEGWRYFELVEIESTAFTISSGLTSTTTSTTPIFTKLSSAVSISSRCGSIMCRPDRKRRWPCAG